ncbi:hypothetical protein LEAN103870_01660 [Legionella anisa]|uniref:Uncharacterized protein n=1 Tax=Legionella anisa TaxID=28082 RepID=A0AAX0WQS9_9GAMM|nr:hypothetical protein [Legionella anisa]KTC72759.1 hypothetical protein Lani_0983 [Legionella anisa]MBN5936892.1 hypothetical protein [Legionella anisa]PNL60702.1 hypothetical protein A6J39_005465 [Legionella anisa]UAK80546.1 hypothetical protein K8O89_05700 [Legionella anisa]
MSQYSTSKMLGKLAAGQSNSRLEEVSQEIEEVGQEFAVPQLVPSAKPSEEMKNVLTNILGPSFSKGYSPMDKK